MQRSSSIALGALVLVVLGLLIWKGAPRPAPQPDLASWSATLPMPSAPAFLAPPGLTLSPLASAAVPPVARALPLTAPKTVRCGVILFQYRGAQFSTDLTRSRPESLELAKAAAETARRDFKAAVKLGDPGSTEDAGRFRRDVLEPAVEYSLFTLAPGGVSEPIDTPRGFWVVRRLE